MVRAWVSDHPSLLALLLHSSAQTEVLETAIIHLISIYSVTERNCHRLVSTAELGMRKMAFLRAQFLLLQAKLSVP